MNPGVMIIGGALLMLIVGALLLGLQIWLAAKRKTTYGFIQPAAWAVCALAAKLLPRMAGTAVQSGIGGIGAMVMAVLSLLVFWLARRRLK